MDLTVEQTETIVLILVVAWVVLRLFFPATRPPDRAPEKMCEPWWKSHKP